MRLFLWIIPAILFGSITIEPDVVVDFDNDTVVVDGIINNGTVRGSGNITIRDKMIGNSSVNNLHIAADTKFRGTTYIDGMVTAHEVKIYSDTNATFDLSSGDANISNVSVQNMKLIGHDPILNKTDNVDLGGNNGWFITGENDDNNSRHNDNDSNGDNDDNNDDNRNTTIGKGDSVVVVTTSTDVETIAERVDTNTSVRFNIYNRIDNASVEGSYSVVIEQKDNKISVGIDGSISDDFILVNLPTSAVSEFKATFVVLSEDESQAHGGSTFVIHSVMVLKEEIKLGGNYE